MGKTKVILLLGERSHQNKNPSFLAFFYNSAISCFQNVALWIYRTQTVEVARADAEKIRLIGSSEATSIEAVGKAEAERMRLKASAYKQYGDAAMLSLVLETLPKVGKLFYIHKALIRLGLEMGDPHRSI